MSEAMDDARHVLWSAGLDEYEVEAALDWVRRFPGGYDPPLVARRIVSARNAMRAFREPHDTEGDG